MLKECEYSACKIMKLCGKLHRLGYTDKPKWMAIILFARNIVSNLSILNSKQKERVQGLVFKKVAARDFSNENFHQIIHAIEDLLVYNEKTDSWLSELESYKHHTDSMSRSIADFVSETITSENSKDHLVAKFGADALETINTKEGVKLDIPRLRSLVTNMLEHYRDEAQKWEKKARQLELIVDVDPLLNTIHNRRALDNHLHGQIEKARANGIPLSLLMVDVDDFKKTINDVYGHKVGDDILRTLAKILTAHASKNNFFAARYGGDELVLVCNLTGDEAEHHAEALRYAVQNYEFRTRVGEKMAEEIIQFTISIGIAEYHGSWTAEELLNAADRAMYHVKDRGKNSVSRFCVVSTV